MYKNVLLPVDLDQEQCWRKTLPVATELTKRGDGVLHVLTVVPQMGMSVVSSYFDKNFQAKLMEGTKAALQTFIQQNAPEGVTIKGHVVSGTIYEEIISAANKLSCDLIVMSAHRPELSDYLLGPNAARVVRHAPQSVMVVRD